jgi:hypothetical protein
MDFALPRQCVDQLLQTNGYFPLWKDITLWIQELNVGDDPKRVRHGNHAVLDLNPIPGNASRMVIVRFSPQRLAATRGSGVPDRQHPRPQVRKL